MDHYLTNAGQPQNAHSTGLSQRIPQPESHMDVTLGSLSGLGDTLNQISSTLYEMRDRLFGSPPEPGASKGELRAVSIGKVGDIESAIHALNDRAVYIRGLANELQSRL